MGRSLEPRTPEVRTFRTVPTEDFYQIDDFDSLLGHNNTDNNNTDCLNVIFSLSGITIKTIVLKNFLHR